MFTQAEMRMIANAVRQVIVSEEGASHEYANAISNTTHSPTSSRFTSSCRSATDE